MTRIVTTGHARRGDIIITTARATVLGQIKEDEWCWIGTSTWRKGDVNGMTSFARWKLMLESARANLQDLSCKQYSLGLTCLHYFDEYKPCGDFGIPICILVNLLKFLQGCFVSVFPITNFWSPRLEYFSGKGFFSTRVYWTPRLLTECNRLNRQDTLTSLQMRACRIELQCRFELIFLPNFPRQFFLPLVRPEMIIGIQNGILWSKIEVSFYLSCLK